MLSSSMAKVTVDIPLERLSMAQEYDIDLSGACTAAIEREMRERAPLGEEHLALAMLADNSIPRQLMRQLGIGQPLADALEETMRGVGYTTPSNRVADKNGNPLGFLYLNADGHPSVGTARASRSACRTHPLGRGLPSRRRRYQRARSGPADRREARARGKRP